MSEREEQLSMDYERRAAGRNPPAEALAEPASRPAGLPAQRLDGPLKRLVESNFLQYASYVIRDRAIPELLDGLKPVQRRILFSLHEKDDGKFIKVANIVGYCMQYHPHGDASIGEALVALANRRYLIEGQGNFGNIFTGDAAAAARYIDCRLTALARTELFNDALTEFVPSSDGRNREPVTLPCKLPLLLMLGADGIAVGLSTRILPHNFIELLEAQIAILQKKKFKILPDFQTGGLMDVTEYDQGNGRVRVRAVIEKRDAETLVIRDIPFGTTTDSLIATIEDAARKKKINIKAIHDFTAGRIEIHIKLAPGEPADKTIQALYAFTACEASIVSRLVVIRDNRPVEMTVDEILKFNTDQLLKLLKRELELARQRLLDELHAKTLVQIFVENRIYKQIEQCPTYPQVQQAVLDGVNRFRKLLRRDVTHADVEMLLEVRIKRISLFDINKNRREMDDIVKELEAVERNLAELRPYAIKYLKALVRRYAEDYPRLTKVAQFETVEVRALTASELKMTLDRANGYFGHGIAGEPCFECSSLDKVILVWGDGRYKMMPPPEKLFVDQNLVYCAKYDRDRVMTMVYTDGMVTYIKRFTFGGAIMNKEYQCAPPGARVHLFTADKAPEIFVKYAPAKGQRIHQQIFRSDDVLVKNVKARGQQMTLKEIQSVSVRKPRDWDEAESSPRGALMR